MMGGYTPYPPHYYYHAAAAAAAAAGLPPPPPSYIRPAATTAQQQQQSPLARPRNSLQQQLRRQKLMAGLVTISIVFCSNIAHSK